MGSGTVGVHRCSARTRSCGDEVGEEALKLVAGPEAVVRAAGCAGNFQIMNRLMDTLGVPVSRRLALAEELGLDLPDHLMPVPGTT